jgi:hypothetical protein
MTIQTGEEMALAQVSILLRYLRFLPPLEKDAGDLQLALQEIEERRAAQ